MDINVLADARPLEGNITCDAAIVGGGMAGLSTAYELASKGLKVVIVDRGPIAGGITARTTAHLAPLCDDLTSEMIKLRGEDTARSFYESQAFAIDRIEQIQADEDIECDFRRVDGYLFQALDTDSKIIDDELDAVRKVGAPVDRIVGVPALSNCQSQHALRYPRQATFHPLKYLAGLADRIKRRDGSFYAHCAVLDVDERNDGSIEVKTAVGHITCVSAVIATNSPIVDRVALHTKMAPYRSYAMAFEIEKGQLEDALYWDTLDPYHYVRVHPATENDYVIVGGGDHKTGEADDAQIRFEAIEAWARHVVPALGRVVHRWSGQVLDTIDYAAFIGRNPGSRNVYVHTGDSGQGITHGVVGGLINSELILGREPRWAEVYEPSRKTPAAVGNFLRENLTAFKNLGEYLAPGELSTPNELKPNQGAIIRDGLTKIAAYRDEAGNLFARSATCTHLGCHLHWNSFETCWDCPCHGSQFAVDGTPLNAPATAPLPDKA
jgi:glycine/D-amino acid oxidase-like deaminating enzyme/nitrite reductase/ring-hydroxylating ferredoxin subunit